VQYALYLLVMSAMVAVFMPAMIESPLIQDQLGHSIVASLIAQNVGLVLVSLLGVGLFVARPWTDVLERLGLTRRFDWRWWLGGTAAGLASAWLLEFAWRALSPATLAQVNDISDILFKGVASLGLLGALLAGILPGIGEEIVFRGAAQPRFGLFVTALLFALIHTQYTVSPALAQILAMGLILGIVRERVNTTTSIAVHASYNILLFLLPK
jgi:membrane protease YdiL (CAAX protease family)